MTIGEFIKKRFQNIKGFDEEELHLIRNKLLNILSVQKKVSRESAPLSSFLDNMLIWEETKEGQIFWYTVYSKLRRAEKLRLTKLQENAIKIPMFDEG